MRVEICVGIIKNLFRGDCNKGVRGVVFIVCGIREFFLYIFDSIFIDLYGGVEEFFVYY